ncbi:D-glycero-alpha-D-manno-heptose 1-phosphate guanylyltransferase [Magnetospirillum gryphiswaldense MSR-1]|uniref:Mannose-1-phosphate guanyltransferase n=2 Tax=Magnetospirillum gryphiswaldense TaxID=55518 RepID=A4U3N3_9PROT|nr:D-glycero-alpha-D-manno-heptose 1-phosphate guanylyltransferase [Magnetospirillum gryphiswaldense MSR-1]AVM78770.1 D-glycero-alpha-D-manno-heptose 1-phosphate guanylyltransferase [Magnetospirillum gryphiswaldense]CAM77490.1 mannose-1-phosphate guanyltransferase [Magnetospirillum gryphiswaldense MSR-1]
MPKGWAKSLIGPDGKIAEALEILETGGLQICLVVDTGNRLIGTITDGDVRRGILKGISLDAPATLIMNSKPRVVSPADSQQRIQSLMDDLFLRHVPMVDANGVLVDLITSVDYLRAQQKLADNVVVLMAGGLGSRLRPLTAQTPKPLLKVGSQPLLEIILENFVAAHFKRFYISVNYKAEMVKDHFGDGSKWGCQIEYLEENERLGTAGALSLIQEQINAPMVVMNGDLLTKVNFRNLLDFHREHDSIATMCVREYDFQVPYGVVNIENHRITGLVEKPIHNFFVNAGIYVLSPQALDYIPKGQYYDMTQLFQTLLDIKRETAVFPIREYWLDIGHIADFERANGEFHSIFGPSKDDLPAESSHDAI